MAQDKKTVCILLFEGLHFLAVISRSPAGAFFFAHRARTWKLRVQFLAHRTTTVPAAIAALEVAAGSATVATPESLRPFVAPEASVAEEVKEEAVDFDPEEECNIVGDFLGSVGV